MGTATPAFRQAEKEFAFDLFGVTPYPNIVCIPEGRDGAWEVRDAIDVDAEQIYQQLWQGNTLITDNHPNHLKDYRTLKHHATGHVLILGLGLGASLFAILEKPDVQQVTIFEFAPEVIRLVAPSCRSPRVTISERDARTYLVQPGEHYNVVWNGIGGAPAQRAALRRKYAPAADWQGEPDEAAALPMST